jgi:FMN-dependent NADH-azoreductase
LRSIFGFIGITDIHFINAQPMDITIELRNAAIAVAIEAAHNLASNTEWELSPLVAVMETRLS